MRPEAVVSPGATAGDPDSLRQSLDNRQETLPTRSFATLGPPCRCSQERPVGASPTWCLETPSTRRMPRKRTAATSRPHLQPAIAYDTPPTTIVHPPPH